MNFHAEANILIFWIVRNLTSWNTESHHRKTINRSQINITTKQICFIPFLYLCIYRYIVFTKFTLHFSYSEYTKLFEHAGLTHVSLKFLPACMSFYVIKFVFSSSFFTPFLSFFSFSFFYYFFSMALFFQPLACMIRPWAAWWRRYQDTPRQKVLHRPVPPWKCQGHNSNGIGGTHAIDRHTVCPVHTNNYCFTRVVSFQTADQSQAHKPQRGS